MDLFIFILVENSVTCSNEMDKMSFEFKRKLFVCVGNLRLCPSMTA